MRPELLVGRVFGVDAAHVSDDTSAATVPAWDSLAHMTLMLELESEYRLAFSVEEVLAMRDVGTIKRVLAGHGVRW